MAILIKDMEMPKNCHECRFCIQEADTDLGVCADCGVTWKHWEAYSVRPDWCPLVEVPDEQPDRNAQERYEDLCEYFKDCSDKGMGILGDRKEFKAWLERVHWHVVRCDELGRELEKLQSAQPEQNGWVHIDDIYRLISGHSNYHGDNILAALTCLAEGKEVLKPITVLEAQPEQRWIPVTKDTLPIKGKVVIVKGKTGTWDFGTYRGYSHVMGEGDIHLWNWKKNTLKRVYWWMYKDGALPEPYGGEQE